MGVCDSREVSSLFIGGREVVWEERDEVVGDDVGEKRGFGSVEDAMCSEVGEAKGLFIGGREVVWEERDGDAWFSCGVLDEP